MKEQYTNAKILQRYLKQWANPLMSLVRRNPVGLLD